VKPLQAKYSESVNSHAGSKMTMIPRMGSVKMKTVLFVVGLLVILYGVLLVGVSVPFHPLTVIVPVPWSSTPATVDNPQLEPGVVIVLLGIVIAVAAIKS
jgi:hypothetical protein